MTADRGAEEICHSACCSFCNSLIIALKPLRGIAVVSSRRHSGHLRSSSVAALKQISHPNNWWQHCVVITGGRDRHRHILHSNCWSATAVSWDLGLDNFFTVSEIYKAKKNQTWKHTFTWSDNNYWVSQIFLILKRHFCMSNFWSTEKGIIYFCFKSWIVGMPLCVIIFCWALFSSSKIIIKCCVCRDHLL